MVIDQGELYYKDKLAKEAEIHKSSMRSIMEETFKGTAELIKATSNEAKVNEKIESHLNNLLKHKK